ncbi:MAG: glycosyltransferase family 2 protein [Lachnospiraceae bacterium]|nr:glycosyltransferase family 2 protein [Lachnospiraceae bacterium]
MFDATKKKYKLSIIIPMYNAEETISRTLNSIYGSKEHEKLNMEVLVINSGSTDKSEEIVRLWQKDSRTDIKIIETGHYGVSKARNLGLKEAKGQYIIFMDSDDYFGKSDFKGVVDFFDSLEDKADILTYPLIYIGEYEEDEVSEILEKGINDYKGIVNPQTKETKYYTKRDNRKTKYYDKGIGIYNTKEYYWLAQKTVNVVIRNLPEEDRIYFNEELPMGEDSLFMTNYVERKDAIGWYDGVISYNYVRKKDSPSAVYRDPQKSYKEILKWAEIMIASNRKDEVISKYVQSVILDEFGWRFKLEAFFPLHLSDDDYKDWEEKIKDVIQYIEPSLLVTNIEPNKQMNRFHLNNLIKIRGEVAPRVDFKSENYNQESNTIEYIQNNEIIAIEKNFKQMITQLDLKGKQLKIKAIMMFFFSELYEAKPFYEVDGVRTYIENIYESDLGYYLQSIKTNTFYEYYIDIDLQNIKKSTIQFGVRAFEKDFYTSVIDIRGCRLFPDKIGVFHSIKNGLDIQFDCKNFTFFVNDTPNIPLYNYERTVALKNKLNFTSVRDLISLDELEDNVVLYCDAKESNSAFQQFELDNEKSDGLNRYYILKDLTDVNSIDYEKYKSQMMLINSEKYKQLFFSSKLIISSSRNSNDYSPYSDDEIEVVRGLFNPNLLFIGEAKEKKTKKPMYNDCNVVSEKDTELVSLKELPTIDDASSEKLATSLPSDINMIEDDKFIHDNIKQEIVAKKDLQFYCSTMFRGKSKLDVTLKKGDFILAYGVYPDYNGTPRLITDKGFLTSNYNNVDQYVGDKTNDTLMKQKRKRNFRPLNIIKTFVKKITGGKR